MRQSLLFNIDEPQAFKIQLLQWVDRFSTVLFLDSNEYSLDKSNKTNEFEAICAAGSIDSFFTNKKPPFDGLKDFYDNTNDWIFGHLNYDLKNSLEDLNSDNFDSLNIPDIHFFQPKLIFKLITNQLEVLFHKSSYKRHEINSIINDIINIQTPIDYTNSESITLKPRISKKEYILKINSILNHIQKGDIYELNFCQEFYLEDIEIVPLDVFLKLKEVSPTPFSSYYKFKEHYLLSASPERFIRKKGEKIFSQPIKGTIKRGETKKEDLKLINELKNNPKERAENIMIVDLVRNDLAKTAKPGSVKVLELCEIYTYPQVHQMISTVSSIHNQDYHIIDIIESAFPMGSMTGAPKIRAMELIENYEASRRGLFSGSVGYISPSGDFDFNVIIRSILYNADIKYLSYQVGSAITSLSKPEDEYEECLIKAMAMNQTLMD